MLRVTDDSRPGGLVERLIEYHAPLDSRDRESDYGIAWRISRGRIAKDGPYGDDRRICNLEP